MHCHESKRINLIFSRGYKMWLGPCYHVAYTSLYHFRLPFVTKEILVSFFFLHQLIFPRKPRFVTNVRWPHYQLPEILQAEEEAKKKSNDKIRIYVAYNSYRELLWLNETISTPPERRSSLHVFLVTRWEMFLHNRHPYKRRQTKSFRVWTPTDGKKKEN